MKKGLLIFLVAYGFIACNKNSGKTTVEGQVIEKGSTTPVPNANVFLITQKGDVGGSALTKVTISSTTADGNGNFSFSFDADKGNLYYVKSTGDGTRYKDSYDVQVTGGNKNTGVKIPLPPTAFLKIHIKNIYPYNNSDEIHIFLGCITCGEKMPIFYGASVDTTALFIADGNDSNSIDYSVHKNAIYHGYTFKKYCIAHDTTNMNLDY